MTEDVTVVKPNQHLIDTVISSIRADILTDQVFEAYDNDTIPTLARTELDLHANMVVLGKNLFIFESSGRTCNVKPFADELGMAAEVDLLGSLGADGASICCQSSRYYAAPLPPAKGEVHRLRPRETSK